MATSPRFRGSFLSVLRNRHFLFLWIAQGTSQTAQNILNYMVIFLVEELTRSSTQTSLAILTFLIPGLFFASVAGVVIEHVNKRNALVVTTLLRLVAAAGYFVYFLQERWSVAYLVLIIDLLTFLRNCVNQFFWPAESAIVPLLVDREDLLQVNALIGIGLNVFNFVGFILIGPALLKIAGVAVALWVLVGLYGVAAMVLLLIPRRVCETNNNSLTLNWEEGVLRLAVRAWRTVLQELRESWALILRDRHITVAITYSSIVQALALMIGSLAPGFITRVLRLNTEDAVLVIGPAGLGMLAGFLAVSPLTRRLGQQRLIQVSMIAVGISLLAMAGVPVLQHLAHLPPLGTAGHPLLFVVAAACFLLGMANLFVLVPTQTLLQNRTPEEAYGRVFANRALVANIATVGPILLTGAFSDLFGIPQVLASVGVLTLLVAGIMAIYLRPLKVAGEEA